MAARQVLFGFHAVTVRLKTAPQSVHEVHIDATRRDARMRQFVARAHDAGVRLIDSDAEHLQRLTGTHRHQGVAARVDAVFQARTLAEVLEDASGVPLLLVLDGVTDPHNLGACLRVADGAGAHAVIAPKDRSCGLTTSAIKVASGAAETVPYIVVTNLARTMRDLKDRGIWLVGTDDEAPQSIYQSKLEGALGLVLGAEGEGLRRLTKDSCDLLVSIPMHGTVESLNVSVASGVVLYEARRRRT